MKGTCQIELSPGYNCLVVTVINFNILLNYLVAVVGCHHLMCRRMDIYVTMETGWCSIVVWCHSSDAVPSQNGLAKTWYMHIMLQNFGNKREKLVSFITIT